MNRKSASCVLVFVFSAALFAQEKTEFSDNGSIRGEPLSMSCWKHPFYSEARYKISKSFLQNDISSTRNRGIAFSASLADAKGEFARGKSVKPLDISYLADSTTTSSFTPSRGSAFIRSFLIPGWGQKYIGAKTSARTFFTAELALWTSFVVFQLRGHWLEDDYRLYGETHAGLEAGGKADQYFVDVGNFNNIDDYNNAKLRNRDVAGLYDRQIYFWQWNNEANRLRYDDIRVRSESAYSNAGFVIAGVLANHVISGIHAAYLAGRRERKQPQGELPSPHFFVESSMRDIRLVARLQF